MATVQDILTTPASGYNHIDALLAMGPDWNYLTGDGVQFRSTLYYSFDINGPQYEAGVRPLNAAQQQAARQILAYTAEVTGITVAEAATAAAADLHFALADIANPELGGVCYAGYNYTATLAGELTSYSAAAYVYLDTLRTADPEPLAGSWWYQALLHEVGHILGLKHPFEATADMPLTLDPQEDSTALTVMSYTQSGPYGAAFAPYDLAALYYLYGGDGLGGSWGIGSGGLYLTGSVRDDTFRLPEGRVILAGSGGSDTVRYDSPQDSYRITPTADKEWLLVQDGRQEHLISTAVEHLDFDGVRVETASLLYQQSRMIDGTAADNVMTGGSGMDMLSGFNGNDLLISNGGNDLLWGGNGFDTAQLVGSVQDATFTRVEGRADDLWIVSTRFGQCTLIEVEQVRFDDADVRLDLAGPGVINLAGLQEAGQVQYFG